MKITMAHGSGGRSSQELMERIFGKYFSNEILDKMEDGAVIEMEGRLAVSTDTFVVTPLVFKGGDIGKLSVCGTVNDLLVMGAEPKYLTCGFILEEGLELDMLEKAVASMAAEAEKAGVTIIAGDTKVVNGAGGMYINTSGIGIIPEGRNVSAALAEPGDAVILSGNLGDHHACILSARMELENGIESDCACLGDVTRALFHAGIDVHTMRDVTRGGLGTVLNEIAATSKTAIEIDEEKIPVSDEVKGFADILGLDPVYMGNEGKIAVIVPAEQAEQAEKAMKATDHGKDAKIIGRVTEAREGAPVSIRTRLGGTRVLDMLYGEGLPRIC